MKFSDYLKTGKNRYESFDEMITDLSTQKNEREKEAEHQRFLQGVANEVQTYANDWQNFWTNGGTIGTDAYSGLTIAGAKLDKYLGDLQKEYADNEQASNYFTQLSSALQGIRQQEYSLNSANVAQTQRINLATQFDGITEKLNKYRTKLSESTSLSKAERNEYTKLAQEYITVGDKLFTAENGFTNKQMQEWYSNQLQVAKGSASVHDAYSSQFGEGNWEKWGHYIDAEDFEEYASKGADLGNPSWEDSRATLDLFGWKPFGEGETVNNLVTFAEANASRSYAESAGALMNGGRTDDLTALVNAINIGMTDDEKKLYHYLVGKELTAEADELIRHVFSRVTAESGASIAKAINDIDIPVLEELALIAAGAATGVDNFFQGAKQLVSGDQILPSTGQYISAYINEAEDAAKYQKYLFNAASTVGNMSPSILAGSILGPTVGSVVMGLSASGNAYGDALAKGYSKGAARTYSVLVGASEAGLQRLLGGISKLGGINTTDLAGRIAAIDNSLLRIAGQLGLSVGSEILEEELQLFLEPAFEAIIFDTEYNAPKWDEILETAIITALSTGALEGPGTAYKGVSQTMADRRSGKAIMDAEGGVPALKSLAMDTVGAMDTAGVVDANLTNRITDRVEAIPDTAATGDGVISKLVAWGKNRANAVKVGKLARETATANDLANTGSNKADIVKSLSRNDFGDEEANKIADALVTAYNGQVLSKDQQKLLKSVEKNQAVKNVVSRILENAKSTVGQRQDNIRAFYDEVDASRIAKKYGVSVDAAEDKLTVDTYKAILEAAGVKTWGGETAEDVDAVAAESGTETASAANDKQVTGKLEDDTDVDVEGKTFVESTGEVAETVAVKDIGKGGVTLTVNGKTDAAMDDVSFGDEATNERYHYVTGIEGMTAEAANAILQHDDIGKENFARDAVRAFRAGVRNDNRVLDRLDSDVISKEDAESLFKKGREVATGKANAENAEVKAKGTDKTGKKTGGVYYGYEGKTIDQREGKLTRKQKVAVEFAKRMAEKFGANYYFYESYEDENGNLVFKDKDGNVRSAEKGFYDPSDGSIHVSLSAENTLFVISHELVHFIRDWSPVRFKQMADLVMEGFNRQDISAEELVYLKQNEYAENGIELTEEQAFEEVIAAALEDVIAGDRVQEFMMEAEGINKSLGSKIKKFFQDICDLFKEILDVYKNVRSDSPEASIIHKMDDIYQKLQRALVRGVYDAGKNFKKAENTTMEGGVRYSLKIKHSNGYIEEIADARSVSDDKVLEYLHSAKTGKLYRDTYIPVRRDTPQVIIDTLEQVNEKVDNLSMVMQVRKARLSMGLDADNKKKGYGSNVRKHGLSPEEILEILHNLEDPSMIVYQTNRKGKNGEPLPNNVAVFVSYMSGESEGLAVIEFESSINPDYIGREYGDTIYHTVVTVFEPDVEREGLPFDYAADELLLNPNNTELKIIRRQNTRSATGEKHPNTSSELSSKKTLTQSETVVKKISATDSAGNQLSADQQEFFKESTVRDKKGNLLIVYHGTTANFNIFRKGDVGFHFGTKSAARGRAGYGKNVNIIAVYLNITNPIVFDEDLGSWDADYRLTKELYNRGILTMDEAMSVLRTDDGRYKRSTESANKKLSETLIAKGYDGIAYQNTFETKKATTSYIAFSAEQVKSIDNQNPTDNPDIRYSVGRKTEAAVQEVLEKENADLREDVAKLKELVKLQGQETGGTKFTASSVLAAARYLKKNSGTSGNTKELAKMLNDFYEYIATSKDLTWEAVREQALPIANWIMDQVEHTRSDYAQEVLDQMKGGKVYLDETQMKEAEHLFGSYNDFRKSVQGAMVISKSANMSLDVWWQEMSTLYPDVFDVETTASDMPRQLGDIISSLRNENSSALEYAYNRRWIEQDLVRDIYDSYWRVSNLRTVADRYAAQRNKLISEHHQRINNLKADNREKMDQLREQHRAEVEMIRKAYEQKSEKERKQLAEKYKESRAKAAESRNKTTMRHKVLRVVKELNSMLQEDSKKRHVPDSLKKAVAGALDILNLDTTNTEERVAKYQKLIAEETDPDKIDAYQVTLENIIRAGEKMGEKLSQLHTAYQEIKDSKDPDIQGGYDSAIDGAIKELAVTIGTTPINKLSIEQLEDVYNVFKGILTRVRDANKSLVESIKESISVRSSYVISEVKAAGGTHADRLSALDGVKRFGWNNLKPVYAFEEIGSQTLTEAFNNVRRGEDTWALDVTAARAYFLRLSKEYGYDNWDMDKVYTFEAIDGQKFELTLEQMMSLYAYSKRAQADDHLRLGGFVFDSNIEFKKEKVKDEETGEVVKKTVLKYKKNTADAHQIDLDTMQKIVETVSGIEGVKDFVDGMQDYLSTTMGSKGNEVTMKMYGIKLFKEENYFPLKSAKQFLFEQNEVSGEVRIKNSGFTNKLVAGANNPIILSNFMDVWCQHVNDMSMYHAFTLPLEDFNRIFNYTTGKAEGMAPKSVKGTIQDAYSPAAVSYIKQLITDLNGGAVSDPREVTGQKLMGKWKKAKVMASLSVVIQQPTSIARAFAMVDPKYFVGKKTGMTEAESWEELKKYAPVAIIKEMGYFDTGMGLGVKDFIQQKEYEGIKEKAKGVLTDSNYRDEVLGKAPAKADEITWVAIWNAVKRETAGRHPDLKPGTEEYLKAAGERFTEVVTMTQVYDSVLARSANMRSKGTFMNMATAFLAEPTTTINMAIDAIVKWSRGEKKLAVKILRAVMICNVINNMLSSLVYAMRDDDEEETFIEKYMQSLVSGIIDDMNPMTYFPWLKDVWSILQGYDVNRSDMSLISDAFNAGKGLIRAYDRDENLFRAWLELSGSVGNFLGVPVENMIREGYAFVNTWDTWTKDWGVRDTTWGSLGDAIGEALKNSAPVYGIFASDSKTDDLYDAVVSGDQKYLERFKGGYVDKDGNFDESKYNTALKQGLRDNDERIREAAEARIDGDYKRYNQLLTEIKSEGKFSHSTIRDAIFAEENDIRKDNGEGEKEKSKSEAGYETSFTNDDYFSAVFAGDTESAEMIYKDLMGSKLSDGYLNHEAADSISTALATEIGNRYMDGEISRNQAVKLLTDNTDKGEAEVKKWDFEMKYGFSWGNRARRYRSGKISRKELENWVMDIEGADRDEAKAYVDFLDLEIENPNVSITAAEAESYFANAKPANIDISTYLEFKDKVSGIKGDVDPKTGKAKSGSKKEKVLKYIHSLPLTVAQKDALYRSQDYAENDIKNAPWH